MSSSFVQRGVAGAKRFTHPRLVVAGAIALILVAVVVVVLARRHQNGTTTFAAPSNAVSFALAGSNTLAVLAGQPGARGVFLIDSNNGSVKGSFSVTGTADAIAAAPDGTILVGVGTSDGERSVGTVEFWNQAGTKEKVLPMPAAVGALTPVVDGHVYALVGTRAVRAAVEIDAAARQAGPTIPLSPTVDDLTYCKMAGHPYLIESTAAGLVVRDEGGRSASLPNAIVSPVCAPSANVLYGIVAGMGSRSIAVMTWPYDLPAGTAPAPSAAYRLALLPTGDLAVLNGGGAISNITVISHEKLVLGEPVQ